jgi:ferric-dicitrate binding protein FerR (iron transport regulator)
MSHPWDWDYLIHLHISGQELTEEQRTALNERLRKFPRLRRRLAEMAFEQAAMRDALQVSEAVPILILPQEAPKPAAAPLLKPLPPPEPAKEPRSRRLVPVVAAAILLIGIVYWAIRGPEAPYKVVDGEVKVEGSKVEVSAAAPASFKMSDGSEAKLAPSTSAIFHGRKDSARQVVEISQGAGSFKVAKAPDSFRVDTPSGRVLVLGTEFSVELRKQKKGLPALAVAVSSGRVRVEHGGKSLELGPGENRVFGAEEVEKKDPPIAKKDPPKEPRPEVKKEAPKEQRPVFNGVVYGKVVNKGDAALLLTVERVVSSRKDSSPEIAETLPGRTLKVTVGGRRRDGDPPPDKIQMLFVRKVEVGQELTLDVRQIKGDDFAIGALTEAQAQWAIPPQVERRKEDKKVRDPESVPDRPDKREDK